MPRKHQDSFTFIDVSPIPSIYYFEVDLTSQGYALIAGLDEAGRGPLAGPVVAGCVILKPGQRIEGVNDSKKLTEKQRDDLARIICYEAYDFGVGIVEADEIDRINILQATKKAMILAVEDLKHKPDYLLIDACTINLNTPQKPLIKGDSRSASIAAASIIAKTTRDNIMHGLHAQYPEYGFAGHKGYGAKSHMDALEKHGPCPAHRLCYKGVLKSRD